MEIDTVRCAMWNKAADRFEMPFVAADFGVPQFEGAMAPVFMLTEGDKSDLKDGYVYDLLVQTRVNDNETFGYVSKVLGEQKPSYSLASMLSVDRMKENATYSVKADDLTVMHISPDSLTIYAKDAAKGVNATVPADGQTDYLGSDKYAQHNWVAITLPQPLDSAQMADFPGRHILDFDAELTSKAGVELKAVAVPAVGEKIPQRMSTVISQPTSTARKRWAIRTTSSPSQRQWKSTRCDACNGTLSSAVSLRHLKLRSGKCLNLKANSRWICRAWRWILFRCKTISFTILLRSTR